VRGTTEDRFFVQGYRQPIERKTSFGNTVTTSTYAHMIETLVFMFMFMTTVGYHSTR